ncbi:MAG: division/cell wall cluster transcriptional repressor MraZ [Treponema sp.]|nr:division/cell wall cluster transcriptional repressor MraZ [Treponema sp.]
MKLLTGEYNNALDDKGRLSFPAKLRTELEQNVLIVTRSYLDHCLQLFTVEEWEQLKTRIMASVSPFSKENMNVVRRFIAPAQAVEFDKAGRLSIPQSLREYAGLSKDCTVLGVDKFIEVWDSEKYRQYLESTEDQFQDVADDLRNISF